MKELIDVFKMEEIPIDTRIDLLRKLRELIDYQYAANVAGPVVECLVSILESRK